MEIPTKQIDEATKDVELLSQNSNIIIKTEEDRKRASDLAVDLKKKLDALEDTRTSLVKPLNDHVKTINSKFKPFTEKLEFGISKLKRGIANYLLEEERKAKEEEDKRIAKQEAKNAKREAEGKAPIIKTIESVERPSFISKSEGGGKTGGKKVWKFEVINPEKVPVEFLSPDVDKIKMAVSLGKREIEGVRIYEDIIISTFKN